MPDDQDQDRSIFRLQHVDEAKDKLKRGVLPEELIRDLHAQGLSIVECIWVISTASGLSLEATKNLVVHHPVWEGKGEPGA
jgi:hypothetical protein